MTYERLSKLEDVAVTCTPEQVSALPTAVFNPEPLPSAASAAAAASAASASGGGVNTACMICLIDFERKETLTVLPHCLHRFHLDCVTPWLLKRSNKCPICKTRVEGGN